MTDFAKPVVAAESVDEQIPDSTHEFGGPYQALLSLQSTAGNAHVAQAVHARRVPGNSRPAIAANNQKASPTPAAGDGSGRAEGLLDHLRGQENKIEHMYVDTTAHVTVGIGHQIPNAQAAAGLPFVHANDG